MWSRSIKNRSILVLLVFLMAAVFGGCGGRTETEAVQGTETEAVQESTTEESTQEAASAPAASELPSRPGMIFNTQTNELGKLTGGEPGDQNGHETRICRYSNGYRRASYPWSFILHCTDPAVRRKVAVLAVRAAENDNIGYDTSEDGKKTFWEEVSKADYDPAKVETPCSANCATAVLSLYRCAGYRLGIEALENIDSSANVWEMDEVLMPTGLFEKITDEDRLHSPDDNVMGDIYVAESRHTILQVTDGKDVE